MLDSSNSFRHRFVALAMAGFFATTLIASSGCLHHLVATGIYLVQGGNVIPPAYDGLEKRRVVVACRPPSSHEYRHAGAARNIARRISMQLANHVPGIDVVDSKEVDNWADESDWDDFKELGRAVEADSLLYIELDEFDLFKGRTLYQGQAEVTISVYDMKDRERIVYEKSIGEILYPQHSGIPAQDKSVAQFQREFEEIVSQAIAEHFYEHDPHAAFAQDALANR